MNTCFRNEDYEDVDEEEMNRIHQKCVEKRMQNRKEMGELMSSISELLGLCGVALSKNDDELFHWAKKILKTQVFEQITYIEKEIRYL